LLSLEGKGPATLGIREPVLVLPEWFLSQASEDELSSTLCHELAHIRRHDFLLNLVYELFVLPISFHPAAVLIKARIDQTRELACDEIAAESPLTRNQYARSLLSIAQSMAANQRPATVGYALGLFDTNTLEDRIMNVLAKTNRIRKTWARASALAAYRALYSKGSRQWQGGCKRTFASTLRAASRSLPNVSKAKDGTIPQQRRVHVEDVVMALRSTPSKHHSDHRETPARSVSPPPKLCFRSLNPRSPLVSATLPWSAISPSPNEPQIECSKFSWNNSRLGARNR
jgi:hypothetical protein